MSTLLNFVLAHPGHGLGVEHAAEHLASIAGWVAFVILFTFLTAMLVVGKTPEKPMTE